MSNADYESGLTDRAGIIIMKKIDYRIIQKDFMIVNIAIGIMILVTFGVMLLQQLNILPSFPCGLRQLFGVYCPGCGGTRALFALFHGHFLRSLVCNPAIILGGLLILYYEAGVILTLVKKNGKRYFYYKKWPLYLYLTVVMLFAVIRDILLVKFQLDMLEGFTL